MFTGIIEAQGVVDEIVAIGSNLTFRISSPLSQGFKPDQSVSHDGVCLTVEKTGEGWHQVTAVDETLKKTTISGWKPGDVINLEQCLPIGGRLDGHFVQGHIDATGLCRQVDQKSGSTEFTFGFDSKFAALVIEKGSVCVNGISLTAFNVGVDHFTVAIIPYTIEHTNLKFLKQGDSINLEFDVLGKYILRSKELAAAAPIS